MGRVDIQFLDEGFHRVLFDAMPVPAFVVDQDMSILDYNAAAARLVGRNKRLVVHQRGGEVLHCVNFMNDPVGCGHTPACSSCVVRESVKTAARGHRTIRRRGEIELVYRGRPTRLDLRVSCQPITFGKSSFILLMLEGLNNVDEPLRPPKTVHGRPASRRATL